MYSNDRNFDVRELELFLFGGVPESTTQIHETDFFGHSETRKNHCPTSKLPLSSNVILIEGPGMIVDLETGKIRKAMESKEE